VYLKSVNFVHVLGFVVAAVQEDVLRKRELPREQGDDHFTGEGAL
jgi:hypothetical protein